MQWKHFISLKIFISTLWLRLSGLWLAKNFMTTWVGVVTTLIIEWKCTRWERATGQEGDGWNFHCSHVYQYTAHWLLIAIVLRGHAAFLSHLGFLGHLSRSCDLLLWVGVRRCLSCVNIFFSRTTGPILTKLGV